MFAEIEAVSVVYTNSRPRLFSLRVIRDTSQTRNYLGWIDWTECGEVFQWSGGTGGDRFYTYGRVRSSDPFRGAGLQVRSAADESLVSLNGVSSSVSDAGLCRPIPQGGLQRRDQLRACRRPGLRQLESIAEGKHGVDA